MTNEFVAKAMSRTSSFVSMSIVALSAALCGFFHNASHGQDLKASREIVVQEDFEDSAKRWEFTDDSSWDWRETNGKHTLAINKPIGNYTPKVRSPHNIALLRDIEVEDFQLKLKVRSLKDTGDHRDCCVFFGYRDPEHFYYVHLGAKPDPASGQIMIVNGEPRRPLTKNENRVPWTDDWHTVMVRRRVAHGEIEVYFDDLEKPIMTVNDKTFVKGRIGIGSFDDMNEFDDIELSIE